ncbi:MAG TPA: DUF4339 domain-containing protein [Rudaea sp.]|nr:DUF4339 domain-containing protein [Rudaea sp.]
MDVWLMRANQKYGPYSLAEVEKWWRTGQLHSGDLIWHVGLPTWIPPQQAFIKTPSVTTPQPPIPTGASGDHIIRRLADYEKISAWLWMILGIVQVLTLVAAIAGVWNIFAAYSRFHVVPRIKARDPEIPTAYEELGGIILIGVVNLFVGGVIGVVFAVFDLYVRDKVLSNRHLFNAAPAQAAPASLPA